MIVGIGVAALLEALFGGPGTFWTLAPASFFAGLVLAFVVLIRLYRALPARLRQAIEVVDDDDPGSGTPSVARQATTLTGAELAALDAKFGPPANGAEQDG